MRIVCDLEIVEKDRDGRVIGVRFTPVSAVATPQAMSDMVAGYRAVIPSIVARQVRETVLDYLRTTFALADRDFETALFDFLDGEEGLFKACLVALRAAKSPLIGV